MQRNKIKLLTLLFLIIIYPGYSFAIPAFPGAEGFGAESIGGRGGKVIKVTNLNDSGSGSFRAAVTAAGPRIVIFTASGIINLESDLIITNSYLTIAGETSPGGILITGYTTFLNASHAIIRHIRFRVGSHRIADGADGELLDAFTLVGSGGYYFPTDAHDIIIDHCSFSWGVDETASVGYNPKNVTFQWNIISEALNNAGHPKPNHSKGFLLWGKGSPDTKVSFHHNYMAHNLDRNPMINTGNNDVFMNAVNNVIYNYYGSLTMQSEQDSRVNWIHNYSKAGPEDRGLGFAEVTHLGVTPALQLVYVEGNLGVRRQSQSDPQWSVGNFWHPYMQSTDYQRLTPWPVATAYPVTTTEMSYDYALDILKTVGATKPTRDDVDKRVVADFISGTGAIIDNISYPDDFPTFQAITAPVDSDNDGMPDDWELANGLNTGIDDSGDINSNGYSNIEEYLHCLASDSTIISKPTGLKAL